MYPVGTAVRADLGMIDVEKEMAALLAERELPSSVRYQLRSTKVVHEMVEAAAYVAIDFEQAENSQPPAAYVYTLPGGEQITLTRERYQCTEVLFEPSRRRGASPVDGLAGLAFSAIHSTHMDARKVRGCPPFAACCNGSPC